MIEKQIDFSKYSSIRIGGIFTIKIAQNINEALNLYKNHFLIGKVNNILLSHKEHDIFQLGSEFDYIKDSANFVEVGARSVSKKVFLYFKNENLSGLEFLGSLPGSIGGIVKMNAGMKQYEIKNALHSICINGEWKDSTSIDFTYRNSNIDGVISAVRFKKIVNFNKNLESLFKQMRSNQPKEPSCGSCFKNPDEIPAGKLLEMANLRGYKIGNMAFSPKHANFLVNTGGGTFDEALELINLAKDRIYNEYKIKLENEIIIL